MVRRDVIDDAKRYNPQPTTLKFFSHKSQREKNSIDCTQYKYEHGDQHTYLH